MHEDRRTFGLSEAARPLSGPAFVFENSHVRDSRGPVCQKEAQVFFAVLGAEGYYFKDVSIQSCLRKLVIVCFGAFF